MERITLGGCGIDVSPVGLGTWPMGGDVNTWGAVDDRESIATIHEALDCGISVIDTAPIYGLGHAEEIVGKAIRERRHEALVATKCGLLFPKSDDEVPPRCLSRDNILRECELSLRRLRIETIDLYQCHWPDPNVPIDETMEAMTTLLDHGKIRAIGVSNFSCEQLRAARAAGSVCSLQLPFSLLHRHATDDLIPYCLEYRIGVLAYGPLAKGLLTGKFNASSRFNDLRARDAEFQGSRFRRNLRIVEELRSIARTYDKTVAQLAINWTACHSGVTTALVGAKRPSQVLENVGGVGWEMSEADRDRIAAIVKA